MDATSATTTLAEGPDGHRDIAPHDFREEWEIDSKTGARWKVRICLRCLLKKRWKGQMKREIKQFVIGKDFSETEIELLVMRLSKWFQDENCDRQFDDPEQSARDIVQQCLDGTTKDGSPWKVAPAEFATRIKVKAAYGHDH
jgi:hypothetical protein